MLLNERLKNYTIVLASGSPRRQQIFKDLGLEVEIRLKEVEEIYPPRLYKFEISDYLAQLKALPHKEHLGNKEILITSDAIEWGQEQTLVKSKNSEWGIDMLPSLSGKQHQVSTCVCLTTTTLQKAINHTAYVFFRPGTREEINGFVDQYKPY